MYQEVKHRITGELIAILRLSDGANIPLTSGNKDYQEYLHWLTGGNAPAEDPYFSIDAVRGRKWIEIKDQRDGRKSGGVKVGQYWYHSDDTSRIQWLGIKDSSRDILANGGTASDHIQILGQTLVWKTMSGEFTPVTVDLAFSVNQAIKDLDAILFATAEAKRQSVNASQEPETIDVTTGWPQTFVESIA